MITIAICDDEEKCRMDLLSALDYIEDNSNEKFSVESYSSGESLLEALNVKKFNIILLDILMEKGMDGLEVAKQLKMIGEDSLIIFISSYDERVKELFGMKTIAFIDKPVDINILEKNICEAINILKSSKGEYFYYKKSRSIQYISMDDIIYFESRRNRVSIHTNKYAEEFVYTISTVWEQLQTTDKFIMPHRSFIFNLKYINIKSDKVIIRDTGREFNIGNKFKEDTLHRYSKFVEKRWQ